MTVTGSPPHKVHWGSRQFVTLTGGLLSADGVSIDPRVYRDARKSLGRVQCQDTPRRRADSGRLARAAIGIMPRQYRLPIALP